MFKNKYLKYKKKYLKFKNQLGGLQIHNIFRDYYREKNKLDNQYNNLIIDFTDQLNGILDNNSNNIDEQDFYKRTILSLACSKLKTDIRLVNLLLKKNANPNIINIDGRSPLYYAVINNNYDIVSLLLEKNADPNIIDIDGRSPLYYAINNNNSDIVSLLLEKNAEPNIIDNDGRSPLYYAINNNSNDIVSLLLEKNADPNIIDSDNNSLLYYAAINNNSDIVSLLLDYKFDINYILLNIEKFKHFTETYNIIFNFIKDIYNDKSDCLIINDDIYLVIIQNKIYTNCEIKYFYHTLKTLQIFSEDIINTILDKYIYAIINFQKQLKLKFSTIIENISIKNFTNDIFYLCKRYEKLKIYMNPNFLKYFKCSNWLVDKKIILNNFKIFIFLTKFTKYRWNNETDMRLIVNLLYENEFNNLIKNLTESNLISYNSKTNTIKGNTLINFFTTNIHSEMVAFNVFIDTKYKFYKYYKNKLKNFRLPFSNNLTFIIKGHGMIVNTWFKLEENTNIISTGILDKSIGFNSEYENKVLAYYKNNNTFFENNDKSYTFTNKGEILKNDMETKFSYYKIKNHLSYKYSNTYCNDYLIHIYGRNCTPNTCNIEIIGNNNSMILAEFYNYEILLSDLIKMLGEGSYILFLCKIICDTSECSIVGEQIGPIYTLLRQNSREKI